MSTRGTVVLGAATAAVLVTAAAAFLVRSTSTYFTTDGRTELGLPVPEPEPVLLRLDLLIPQAGDSVEVIAVRPTMSEGPTPGALIYDPGPSKNLVGITVESAWTTPEGAALTPFTATTFGTDAPQQVVLRIAPSAPQVTLGPIAIEFRVNGGGLQTQDFEVFARACFGKPLEHDCRPPARE